MNDLQPLFTLFGSTNGTVVQPYWYSEAKGWEGWIGWVLPLGAPNPDRQTLPKIKEILSQYGGMLIEIDRENDDAREVVISSYDNQLKPELYYMAASGGSRFDPIPRKDKTFVVPADARVLLPVSRDSERLLQAFIGFLEGLPRAHAVMVMEVLRDPEEFARMVTLGRKASANPLQPPAMPDVPKPTLVSPGPTMEDTANKRPSSRIATAMAVVAGACLLLGLGIGVGAFTYRDKIRKFLAPPAQTESSIPATTGPPPEWQKFKAAVEASAGGVTIEECDPPQNDTVAKMLVCKENATAVKNTVTYLKDHRLFPAAITNDVQVDGELLANAAKCQDNSRTDCTPEVDIKDALNRLTRALGDSQPWVSKAEDIKNKMTALASSPCTKERRTKAKINEIKKNVPTWETVTAYEECNNLNLDLKYLTPDKSQTRCAVSWGPNPEDLLQTIETLTTAVEKICPAAEAGGRSQKETGSRAAQSQNQPPYSPAVAGTPQQAASPPDKEGTESETAKTAPPAGDPGQTLAPDTSNTALPGDQPAASENTPP